MIPILTNTRHRIATNIASGMVVMMVAALFAVGLPNSLARADYCEVVACWPECRPVPGGRWCRTICRRRCWREPTPSYDSEAHHAAPSYAPTSPTRRDPLITLSVLAGLRAAS
jgi:hypothetical protein